MTGQAFAILLAGSFTFGCAAIHAWREHAPALTAPLAAALVCLSILAGSVVLVKSGGPGSSGLAANTPRQSAR